jgi:hypothetical protein
VANVIISSIVGPIVSAGVDAAKVAALAVLGSAVAMSVAVWAMQRVRRLFDATGEHAPYPELQDDGMTDAWREARARAYGGYSDEWGPDLGDAPGDVGLTYPDLPEH